MYKLISTDLDGTLLNSQKQVSPRNEQLIRQCYDQGIIFVLNSGRAYPGINAIARKLGLHKNWHVCYNGGGIFNTDGEFESFHLFDAKDYRKLVNHLHKTCHSFVTANADGLWYEREGRCKEIMTPNNGDISWLKTENALSIPSPFQICANYVDDQNRDDILSQQYDTIEGCVSSDCLIDYYPKAVNKYSGVLKIARAHGIREEEIITIGDSDNDYDLISRAALGVCVKNATENIKNVADVVLDVTNDEDALAVLIERFIFRKETV